MTFLFRPRKYFRERTQVSFFVGVVAVFFTGGFSYFSTLVIVLWSSVGGHGEALSKLTDVAVYGAPFFSSFVWWFFVATFFFIVIYWDGLQMDVMGVLSLSGLGFFPIALGRLFEFILTVYFVGSMPGVETTVVSSHALLSGSFGLIPAISVLLIRTVMLVWAGLIWKAGVKELGRVSNGLSSVVTGVVILVFWVYLVGIGLFA